MTLAAAAAAAALPPGFGSPRPTAAAPASGPPATARRGTARRARVPFDLGIASYTLRSFSLDQAIAMTQRLRIKKLTLKDMHLPMAITPEEMAAVHAKLKAAGLPSPPAASST